MTYYIAGLPYSAELYHHGIKGQKWGIRRYQNADGTLTQVGKERYGTDALPTNSNSRIRRFLSNDYGHFSSAFKIKQRREDRLLNKINKDKKKGKDTSKLENAYKAQKQRNIDLEKYIAKTSTKNLIAQALLLPDGGRKYRETRARGANMARAFMSSSIGYTPVGYILDKYAEKVRYGAFVHSGIQN